MSKRLCKLGALGLSCFVLLACQTPPEAPPKPVEVPVLADPPEPEAPPDPTGQARKDLEDAQGVYTEGRYDEAVRLLGPLAADTSLPVSLRMSAMKFMAFSQCALNRVRPCRQQFDAALELDPSFQLTEAEKGHPVWGREFRNALTARNAALTKANRRATGKSGTP
jgi:hypothetical protein